MEKNETSLLDFFKYSLDHWARNETQWNEVYSEADYLFLHPVSYILWNGGEATKNWGGVNAMNETVVLLLNTPVKDQE